MKVYIDKRLGVELRLGRWQDVLTDIKGINCFLTSPPYNLLGSGKKAVTGFRKFGKPDPKSYGGPQYPDHLPESEYQI